MMTPQQVREMIAAGLPDAQVEVRSDDNTHFEAVVVSAGFEGQRSIQRHQAVYRTLGQYMGREIHALSLRAFTPDELARQGG